MSLTRKFGMVKDLALMGVDLGLMRYPSFVYGKRLGNGEMPPVLCLHTGTPEAFEQWCKYLSHNGLNTLDSSDYLDCVQGRVAPSERDVYLTFDDGHLSIWTVVEPLLHKYGLKGTSFLIPGRMPELGTPEAAVLRPRLDDVWNNSSRLADLDGLDQGGYSLASWAENEIMHERGCMDFQAHTYRHSLIVVADEVIGYVTPDIARTVHPFELAMLSVAEDDGSIMSIPALGTPIYASASRMSSKPACKPDVEATLSCVQLVAAAGGECFFEQPDWQQKLNDQVARNKGPASFETPEQQYQAVLEDLRECRLQIEQALPGKHCTHLAYPWGVGSDIATRAAVEAGYESAYWGRVQARLTNSLDTDPLKLARIGEDFFSLLPGKQRGSLPGTLLGKLTRRLKTGSPYLSH